MMMTDFQLPRYLYNGSNDKVIISLKDYQYLPRFEEPVDWNQRYSSEIENWLSLARALLREHAPLLTHPGIAFEAAMGMGNNLGFLLEHGYRVMGVERSEVAIKYVHSRFPSVTTVLADLSTFQLPSAAFDLICNFYYLEMNLWKQFHRALNPGGLLFIETLTDKMLEYNPEINPERLLSSGTLPDLFKGFEILDYKEAWITSDRGNRKAVASLIARKPI
jgi:tellurite methyltransferase